MVNFARCINMKMESLICPVVIAVTLAAQCVAFADPFISSVVIGEQSPAMIMTGGAASYAVAVTKTNSGGVDAYLTVSGLPAGITALFTPTPIVLKGGDPASGTSTLNLSVSNTTPAGVYSFILTARDGKSPNYLTAIGTLIVSANGSEPAPLITSVSCVPARGTRVNFKGAPKQLFLIQAATNLFVPSWTTIATNTTDLNGLSNLIDEDGGRYRCRFFRTAKLF